MYTLRIPFELPSGYKLEESQEYVRFGDLEFKLKSEMHLLVLVVRGFCTEIEAKHFLRNAWSGFSWFLLKCGMAPIWDREPQQVEINVDPAEAAGNVSRSFGGLDVGDTLHGIFDGSKPAIFETAMNFRTLTGGRVGITQSSPSNRFFDYFNQGLAFDNWEEGLADNRLCIALDLYGAFFAESTASARFPTLIMVLEALAEPTRRPPIAVDLIKEFHERIEEILSSTDSASQEWQALEALKREIDFRQQDSIRSQVRLLVLSTLSQAGEDDAAERAREALRLYDARSTLLHNGHLAPEAWEWVNASARPLVQRVLTARFLNVAR